MSRKKPPGPAAAAPSAPTGLESYLDVEEREARQFHKHTWRRLFGYIFLESRLLVAGCGLMLLGTAATLSEPRLFGYAIDEAIVPKRGELVTRLALAFLLVEVIRVLAVISSAYVFEMLGQKVMQSLRLQLFAHLQVLPVSVYDKNPVGRLVTRLTNDIASMAEMFSQGFVTMFGNVLIVAGILAWLLVLDLKLGLIAASVFPILAYASIYFSGRLQIAYRNARSKLSALNAFLAENILGMRVVHLFNRQKLHLGRFGHVNQWYTDAQISSVRVFAFFQPTITWCAGASMALVVYYGGGMTLDGTLKLGVLVAYFSYILALFQPMREIADKWNVFLSGMASAERIFSILDWAPELGAETTQVAPIPAGGIRGEIVFENVWFAYSGEHWVLKDFSLEIKAGMRVGIVGHTGAGKTTLISLLMRFYEPTKGRILLDGKDLREYDKRALRAAIGIVQQDVFLFSGGIRDNITLWRQPTEWGAAAVEATLASMGLDGWLKDGGLELQERGANLSMGQRQIVAFTRALSIEPSIWILDEATANIDSQTEQQLEISLQNASKGRTTILIAHRLATVRGADMVLVLHKGSLVERGKHAELMRLNGLYARLYRYQTAVHRAGETVPVPAVPVQPGRSGE